MKNCYDRVLRQLSTEYSGWQVLLDYDYPIQPAKPVDVMLMRRGMHDFAFQSRRLTDLLLEHHLVLASFSVHYSTTQNVTYVDIRLAAVAVPKQVCLN